MPGYILFALLGAVAVLLAVLIVRALCFKKPAAAAHEPFRAAFDEDAALRNFSLLLKKQTIWPRYGEIRKEEFDSFLPLLQELYPNACAAMKLHRINEYGILMQWRGSAPGAKPVVLMSHYDVVDADPVKWTLPPFCGEVHAGAVWGRGAVDTKCILAALMQASEILIQQGFQPKRDLFFSFSNNEESGGDTTPAIVDWLFERGIEPWFVLDEGGAIVNSPALGVKQDFAMVGVSEKGILDAIIRVRGVPGHAATPKDTDATTRLVKVVSDIQHHQFEAKLPAVTRRMLSGIARYSNFGMRLIFANLWLFSPLVKFIMLQNSETNAMLRTTAALTKLKGSQEINIIPTVAEAAFSVRVAPWDNTEKVIRRLRTVAGEHADLSWDYRFEPSPISPDSGKAFDLLKRTVDDVYPAVQTVPYVMNGGTDARHFSKICKNVYRFAGFRFSEAERASMHGNDEKLEINSYLDGVHFYVKLLMNLNEEAPHATDTDDRV